MVKKNIFIFKSPLFNVELTLKAKEARTLRYKVLSSGMVLHFRRNENLSVIDHLIYIPSFFRRLSLARAIKASFSVL
jgi:hypothetical protein